MGRVKLEKEWITSSGYPARSYINTGLGFRCGYVRVPRKSVLFEKFYVDIDFIEVHGGLTYSGYLCEDGEWWLGFDCGHYMVKIDPSLIAPAEKPLQEILEYRKKKMVKEFAPEGAILDDAEIRSLDFVVAECESMAAQIKEYLDTPLTIYLV